METPGQVGTLQEDKPHGPGPLARHTSLYPRAHHPTALTQPRGIDPENSFSPQAAPERLQVTPPCAQTAQDRGRKPRANPNFQECSQGDTKT